MKLRRRRTRIEQTEMEITLGGSRRPGYWRSLQSLNGFIICIAAAGIFGLVLRGQNDKLTIELTNDKVIVIVEPTPEAATSPGPAHEPSKPPTEVETVDSPDISPPLPGRKPKLQSIRIPRTELGRARLIRAKRPKRKAPAPQARCQFRFFAPPGSAFLNLRSWPSRDAPVIARIPDRSLVRSTTCQLQCFAGENWIKVFYANRSGWVVAFPLRRA